jgi:hypothetical protein
MLSDVPIPMLGTTHPSIPEAGCPSSKTLSNMITWSTLMVSKIFSNYLEMNRAIAKKWNVFTLRSQILPTMLTDNFFRNLLKFDTLECDHIKRLIIWLVITLCGFFHSYVLYIFGSYRYNVLGTFVLQLQLLQTKINLRIKAILSNGVLLQNIFWRIVVLRLSENRPGASINFLKKKTLIKLNKLSCGKN